MRITNHAKTRLSERNFRAEDVMDAMQFVNFVKNDKSMITKESVFEIDDELEILRASYKELSKNIKQLERLRKRKGSCFVQRDDVLITYYQV